MRGKKGANSIPKELPKELKNTKAYRKEAFLDKRDLEESGRLRGRTHFFTCSLILELTWIFSHVRFSLEHWDG